MSGSNSSDRLAKLAASAIGAAFDGYIEKFRAITQRARSCFETRDWHEHQSDALERLTLYASVMDRVTAELRATLGTEIDSRLLWARVKEAYPGYADRLNLELARTFYNSVTRRIFATVGVNPDIEFTSLELAIRDWEPAPALLRRYDKPRDLRATLTRVLEDCGFRARFRDLEADVDAAARRVEERIRQEFAGRPPDAIEFVRPEFYRNKGAYLVGRMLCGDRSLPLIFSLLHSSQGVYIDAVLMREAEASIIFSFTRSYFHVDVPCPREMIVFLKAIIPLKPVSDLYSAIGFNKHGKTELYRSLQRHMRRSSDLFDFTSGDRGMVMIVFTLPSYDRVFKVIRDNFDYPKTTTQRDVIERYRLVYRRDRVGRLVEAQLFRHMKIPVDRLTVRLSKELLHNASRSVRREGGFLVFDRLYTERRVIPLNVYLREATPDQVRRAVFDYGAAIKELAAADIFPGDFLVKNFGVTRHERVVFYDYDELCLLTDCRFRKFPAARTPEDELAPEPWFSVGDNDIFPEEFHSFLGLPDSLLKIFEERHADLFQAEFWRDLQEQHRAGVLPNFFPYPGSERLSLEAPE